MHQARALAGGSTEEAQAAIAMDVASKLIACLKSNVVTGAVNAAELIKRGAPGDLAPPVELKAFAAVAPVVAVELEETVPELSPRTITVQNVRACLASCAENACLQIKPIRTSSFDFPTALALMVATSTLITGGLLSDSSPSVAHSLCLRDTQCTRRCTRCTTRSGRCRCC